MAYPPMASNLARRVAPGGSCSSGITDGVSGVDRSSRTLPVFLISMTEPGPVITIRGCASRPPISTVTVRAGGGCAPLTFWSTTAVSSLAPPLFWTGTFPFSRRQ